MLESMTDFEVLAEVKRLGALVSQYEAASGQAYTRETNDRLAAKKSFWNAWDQAKARGLNPETKGFLL